MWIELTTPGLQDQCSSHWAMEAYTDLTGFYDSHALCIYTSVWTDLRQSSIDTVKTDTCKHACYADDNWLQLISILDKAASIHVR